MVGRIIKLDDYVANAIPAYAGLAFVLLKDESSYLPNRSKLISTSDVINFEVPYHRL